MTKMLDDKIDLVYSEDDRGYYLQEGNNVSILYPSEYAATKVWKAHRIVWTKQE